MTEKPWGKLSPEEERDNAQNDLDEEAKDFINALDEDGNEHEESNEPEKKIEEEEIE